MDPFHFLEHTAVPSLLILSEVRYHRPKQENQATAQMSRRAQVKRPSKAPEQYGETQKSNDAFRNAVMNRVSKKVLLSTKKRWQK